MFVTTVDLFFTKKQNHITSSNIHAYFCQVDWGFCFKENQFKLSSGPIFEDLLVVSWANKLLNLLCVLGHERAMTWSNTGLLLGMQDMRLKKELFRATSKKGASSSWAWEYFPLGKWFSFDVSDSISWHLKVIKTWNQTVQNTACSLLKRFRTIVLNIWP